MSEGREIEYIYDAAGVKLAKIIKGGGSVIKRTDYAGSYVYKDKTYDYRIFSHGREVFNRGAWEYEYHIKDHLGNVRVAFSESGTVKQENHYYPFGLRIADLGMNNPLPSDNKYLYNGKEMQNDFGLEWHDYGARFYNAEIGRFHTPDRFSEKYYHFTPYQYAGNNPINTIDVNGDSIWFTKHFNKKTYKYQFTMHVTATVYDGTSYGGWNTEKVAGQLKSDIEEAFTADTPISEFRVNAQITTTKDKSKTAIGNAHLFELRDADESYFEEKTNGEVSAATAKMHGKHVLINIDAIHDIDGGRNFSILGHEFGHLAGLVHPSQDTYFFGLYKGAQYQANDSGNMMHRRATTSRLLTLKQIMTVYEKWDKGQLNKNIFYKD